MYINYTIVQLLLPFLCFAVYYADGQGFVNFPTGNTISSPGTIVSTDGNEIEVDLLMQGATPTRPNQTICTGFNLAPNDLFYIFEFTGHADYSKVHHMGLYACSITPANNACRCPMANRSPLFTWARNTPPVRFTGSGTQSFGVFRVGAGTDRNFIFLESHYFNKQTTPDTTSGIKIRITRTLQTSVGYLELAIFSLMGTGTIPANTPSYAIDTCISPARLPTTWSAYPSVVGFQSHSHNLGRVVSTFYASTSSPGEYATEVGVGNPLWPNAYVMAFRFNPIPVTNGLYLFNRCIYTSTGVANATNTNGPFAVKTAWQEMCVQSMILGHYQLKWTSTTPAFLTGPCSSAQSTAMDAVMPSSFPTTLAATDSALNAYATSGSGSGSYTYTSANSFNYNINLTSQTFRAVFQ